MKKIEHSENRIVTEIDFIIKNEENEKIKQTTVELENMKNDNTKSFNKRKKRSDHQPSTTK